MATGVSDERVLKKLIVQMNTALPSKRIWLSELVEKEEASYRGRDGREYVIEREELLVIRGILERAGLRDVRIPIPLFADSGQEQSAWRVEGPEECAIIAHVLGRDVRQTRDPTYLYLAHMSIIRRMLPTTTVAVFL